MKTNFNYFNKILGIWVVLLCINGCLFSQSSFSYTELDERRVIGLLSYDGSKKSIADGVTIKLQSFTYLSIGRIKKLSSVSNGCVYVLIEYPKKQFILIKSDGTKFSPSLQNTEWSDGDESELNMCITSDDQVTKSDDRRSLYKKNDSQTIAIINVRKQDVALFMYMAQSISFD